MLISTVRKLAPHGLEMGKKVVWKYEKNASKNPFWYRLMIILASGGDVRLKKSLE